MTSTGLQPTPAQSVIAGALGGMTSLLVVQPFDFVRTRLQTTTKAQYRGAFDCIRQSFVESGPLVFYKGGLPTASTDVVGDHSVVWRNSPSATVVFGIGMSLPFLAQGLYKAVMFTTFNTVTGFFRRRSGREQLSTSQLFASGVIAGIVNSFVVTPVELVRNRLIVQRYDTNIPASAAPRAGPIGIIKDVVAKHGVFGMWRGQSATLLRDAVGLGCFYTANNRMMRFLRENTSLGPTAINALGGTAAGLGFWSVALPIDRVKSIIQTNQQSSTNVLQVLRGILQQDGVKGLYRGWSVAFTRGIPSATIVFTTYNSAMDYMLKKKAESLGLTETARRE